MKKPNIVLMISDQHRYDCVGFSEQYPVQTPNMDRLAQEGVWFDNAYSTIPTCCPARQSLIAGKRPERFGAHWNYDITLKIPDLPVEEFSFARALKEQGYRTAYIGKWHVSQDHTPLDYGFDEYYGVEHAYAHLKKNGYKNIWEIAMTGPLGMLGAKSDTPYQEAPPHHLAGKAIEALERLQAGDEPFCLVYALEEPHLPCCPSEPFASMYKAEEVPKWAGFDDTFENKPYIQRQMVQNWGYENLTWEDWSQCAARYYACISQADDAFGQVMKAAEKQEDDTVIIYTADHGDMCGSHRMLDKHYIMYDDVVHVPFIMKWKDHFVPRRSDDFVHNFLDLHATILELAGAVPGEVTDGQSLIKQLEGIDQGRKHAISTYNGQQFGLYNQRMIRNAEYKYIWNLTDVDEFYDMKKDPGELKNEIYNPEYAEVIAQMRKDLYEELKKCEDRLLRSPAAPRQLLEGKKI